MEDRDLLVHALDVLNETVGASRAERREAERVVDAELACLAEKRLEADPAVDVGLIPQAIALSCFKLTRTERKKTVQFPKAYLWTVLQRTYWRIHQQVHGRRDGTGDGKGGDLSGLPAPVEQRCRVAVELHAGQKLHPCTDLERAQLCEAIVMAVATAYAEHVEKRGRSRYGGLDVEDLATGLAELFFDILPRLHEERAATRMRPRAMENTRQAYCQMLLVRAGLLSFDDLAHQSNAACNTIHKRHSRAHDYLFARREDHDDEKTRPGFVTRSARRSRLLGAEARSAGPLFIDGDSAHRLRLADEALKTRIRGHSRKTDKALPKLSVSEGPQGLHDERVSSPRGYVMDDVASPGSLLPKLRQAVDDTSETPSKLFSDEPALRWFGLVLDARAAMRHSSTVSLRALSRSAVVAFKDRENTVRNVVDGIVSRAVAVDIDLCILMGVLLRHTTIETGRKVWANLAERVYQYASETNRADVRAPVGLARVRIELAESVAADQAWCEAVWRDPLVAWVFKAAEGAVTARGEENPDDVVHSHPLVHAILTLPKDRARGLEVLDVLAETSPAAGLIAAVESIRDAVKASHAENDAELGEHIERARSLSTNAISKPAAGLIEACCGLLLEDGDVARMALANALADDPFAEVTADSLERVLKTIQAQLFGPDAGIAELMRSAYLVPCYDPLALLHAPRGVVAGLRPFLAALVLGGAIASPAPLAQGDDFPPTVPRPIENRVGDVGDTGLAEITEGLQDQWLETFLSELLTQRGPTAPALAVGARYRLEEPDLRAAQISSSDSELSPSADWSAWARALRLDDVERQAVHDFIELSISEVSASLSELWHDFRPEDADWQEATLHLLHRRDDIECVLAVPDTRADLSRWAEPLGQLDQQGRDFMEALPVIESLAHDERISRAGTVSIDGWWTIPVEWR